jgi:VanZ family protein
MSVVESPDLKFRLLWLIIGYMLVAIVTFLSLTSNPIDTGLQFPYEDKMYHALAYFTLMAWFAQIYHGRIQRYLIAMVFIVMGCSFEYLQSLDVNRYAEFADIVANVFGVLAGFSLTLTEVKNTLVKIERLAL